MPSTRRRNDWGDRVSETLTTRQAAERMCVHAGHVVRLASQGKLPFIKQGGIGDTYIFNSDDIEKYMKENRDVKKSKRSRAFYLLKEKNNELNQLKKEFDSKVRDEVKRILSNRGEWRDYFKDDINEEVSRRVEAEFAKRLADERYRIEQEFLERFRLSLSPISNPLSLDAIRFLFHVSKYRSDDFSDGVFHALAGGRLEDREWRVNGITRVDRMKEFREGYNLAAGLSEDDVFQPIEEKGEDDLKLDCRQAALILGVTQKHINRMIRENKLIAERVGSVYEISGNSVLLYLLDIAYKLPPNNKIRQHITVRVDDDSEDTNNE